MQNRENILNRGEQTNLQKDTYGHLRLGWEKIKLNVFPCLAPVGWIGEELGTEMEKQMASSDFLDLAVYYYIKLENSNDNRMAIAWISRRLLERWGISMQTLETQALENMAGDGYAINPISSKKWRR